MIQKEFDEKFSAWLEENRDTILEKWMNLARIPSVQSPAQPKAPYGPACAQAMKTAAGYFEELGLNVKINEEDGYAVCQLGEGEKSLGLFGHSDVVPVGDGWLYTEPFQPVIRNGWLIGRGVRDNKSGIMASWCILSALQQLQFPLKNRLQVVVGSNEESGMRDMQAFAQKEEMPELALVPDSAFPCALGEKGILRMWARCNTPLEAITQIQGGTAFNVVLDRVDAVVKANDALAAQLEKDERCAVRPMENGELAVEVTGITKHAAYPIGSLNATWHLAQLLADCEALPQADRACLQTVAKYLQGYWGEGLGIAHEDPVFGKLTCSNGMVKVEDGYLLVSLDIRYGIAYDPKKLEQDLYDAWEKAGWQVTYMENQPGYAADPDSPYPQVLKAIADEMIGRELPFYRMPGGTYGRFLKTAFPVGIIADNPALIQEKLDLPAGHGGSHQRDEAAHLDSFFLGVRTVAQMVLACDAML